MLPTIIKHVIKTVEGPNEKFFFMLCNFVSSDSEDEDSVKKSRKSPKGKQKASKKQSPPRKDPVQYVSETGGFNSFIVARRSSNNLNGIHVGPCADSYLLISSLDSDSDNFRTLKDVSKDKSNGAAKSTKPAANCRQQGVKVGTGSPVSPVSRAVKSPVTPKSTEPPQPKQTPTSVLDYFGQSAVQRSDKKLVASVKRKVVSVDSSCLLH